MRHPERSGYVGFTWGWLARTTIAGSVAGLVATLIDPEKWWMILVLAGVAYGYGQIDSA